MRVGIFGAGQAGMMVKNWLPAHYHIECFIDNNKGKQSDNIDFIPVLSFDNIPELDLIIIAVLNREAAAAIRLQIQESGFKGEITDLDGIRRIQDIRLAALRLAAGQIHSRGAVAELGVYRGDFAKEINRLFPDRELSLFDTFAGFDGRDLAADEAGARDFSDTSVERVRAVLPHPERAAFVVGYFPESLKGQPHLPESYALVSLDADLYRPTKAGLEYFWPRLDGGGMILIHDYTSAQFPGVRRAVDEYCAREKLSVVPLMDLHGTAVLVKHGGEN